MWPFADFGFDANSHAAPPGISGGGGDVRGHAEAGAGPFSAGVSGGAAGDVGYDPSTGTVSGDGGAGGAFSLDLGPLGAVSIGGDLDGRGSGDLSSGSASGKALGFLSGNVLGHRFSLSDSISGGFGW
ncbi:MAG: hypothetical protein K8W52_06165 [Deltaproteobacteria bacterium]|nr:hypothetical protein [Deltaproteobacteria bacterium]